MSPPSTLAYTCSRCGTTYPIATREHRCACGGPFELRKPSATFPLDEIRRRPPGLWRYREALPLPTSAAVVSLGEPTTPLVAAHLPDSDLRWKLDFLFPTGSCKDRGAAVFVSHLAALGVTEVVEDSSGNAGSALAAYCARAGIAATVYCPAHASRGKLAQVAAYGARLRRVTGPREETARTLLDERGDRFYASHNWSPFFLEGTKTAAFEIAEQLGWRAPDHVVTPLGFGSLFLGLYRGFRELLEAGVTRRMPRLLGVQAAACAPIFEAHRAGRSRVADYQGRPTLAEGIATASPIHDELILRALAETGGSVVTVSEEEILDGVRRLARLGLFVEPTSAVVLPGFEKLQREGMVGPGDLGVALLSGSGLKAVEETGPLSG